MLVACLIDGLFSRSVVASSCSSFLRWCMRGISREFTAVKPISQPLRFPGTPILAASPNPALNAIPMAVLIVKNVRAIKGAPNARAKNIRQ